MIIYFANRYMTVLGVASTGLPDGFILQKDRKKIDIDSGVAIFEAELVYTDSNHLKAREMAAAGNYILRSHSGDFECYTIIETEDDSSKSCLYFYAEDAGLDLLNEIVGDYAAPAAQPAAFYINRFTRDSGWEIGINEVEDLSRKLSWEGDATAAERVRSVATQFDAEIGYRFDIDKLAIRHKYIDIYEKRGRDTMRELRLGREVKRIVEKKSIADLVTCLRVTGGTPDGQNAPITLKGYTYDDGDIYIDQAYGDIKCRSALEVWSRYLSETGTGDGHIVGTFSYDTTSQKELCSHAVTGLKERSKPAVNYEVELYYLPSELRIGDTVRIVDDRGELYLSARLLETEERVTDDLYFATFGDFLIKSSGISEKVAELAEKYADLAKTRTLYTWIVYADDAEGSGISLNSANKPYLGIAPNRVTSTPDLSDASVYTWTLIKGLDGGKGEKGDKGDKGDTGANGTSFRQKGIWKASTDYVSDKTYIDVVTYNGSSYACISSHTSGTAFDSTKWQLLAEKGEQGIQGTQGPQGIQGPKGEDGSSRYIHIKYAAVASPTNAQMSEVPDTYIGVCVDANAADPTTASSYTWSRFRGEDGPQGIQGPTGADGKKGYVHFAYAKSADGMTGFSTSSFSGALYIGVYSDNTEAYSSDYTKYEWTLIKGADGASITSVTNYYLASSASSGVKTSTSGWTTDPSASAAIMTSTKQYLWNYEVVKDSTGATVTTTSPVIIGRYGQNGGTGAAGKGIASITEYYLASASASGVKTSTSGWTTAVQTADSTKKYLWNYEVITFTDSSSYTSDPRIIGTYGEKGDTGTSVTVTKTEYAYQLSTSGTTVPTGTWQTSPQAPTTTQFAWTRTTTTFSDGSTAVTYTVGGKTGTNGSDAITYYIESSASAIVKNQAGTLIPASVTFSAKSRKGTGSPAAYAGRFIIAESTDGSSWTNKYTSSANESGKSYTPSANTVKLIRCTLYLAGGTSTQLDVQTVPVIGDGVDGANGTDGKDAYTVILTNESHTFAGGVSAALAGSTTCNVIAYKGATQVAATIGTISGAPAGMSTSITDNGKTSAYFTVTVTTAMVTKNGVLTVPVTVDGKTFNMKFTYALALKGEDGETGGRWYSGTAITGTSTTATIFSGSGITSAVVGDMYLNTSTYNTYRCTVAGAASAAKWVYVNNIKGGTGPQGEAGADAILLIPIITGTSVTAHVFKAGAELTSTQITALGAVNWYADGASTRFATGITADLSSFTAAKVEIEARLEA